MKPKADMMKERKRATTGDEREREENRRIEQERSEDGFTVHSGQIK